MLRFVVLRHVIDPQTARRDGSQSLADRGTHFDLMLEENGKLLTWALAIWPLKVEESTKALSLPPHRLAYLDYEGEISGGRGHVYRVASGSYHWEPGTTEFPRVAMLRDAIHQYRLGIDCNRITALPSSLPNASPAH